MDALIKEALGKVNEAVGSIPFDVLSQAGEKRLKIREGSHSRSLETQPLANSLFVAEASISRAIRVVDALRAALRTLY